MNAICQKRTGTGRAAAGIVVTMLLLLAVLLFAGCGSRTDRYIELGQQCLEELDYEQAILNFTQALEIDPNNVDAYLGRAEAYAALDRRADALADYKQAVDADPERREEVRERRNETVGPAPECVLAAGDLTWAVEPSFAYDDMEPIWADEFSDVAGGEEGSFSDGTAPLIRIEEWNLHLFSELSFPQYSCLPEYYLAISGGQGRLFYMPTREDSGDIVANVNEMLPYIYDSYTLYWDWRNLYTDTYQPRWDLRAPWNVVGDVARGGGGGSLIYEPGSREIYFGWSFDGPGDNTPFSELPPLHKPYSIQQARILHDDEYNYNYYELLDPHYSFVAPDGTILTDFIYDEVGEFSDGIAACERDGKWGYIDDTGAEITDFVFDAPWHFISGWYDMNEYSAYPSTCDTMVVEKDGQMGVLYRDGSLLIDYGQFEDLAPAWNNQLWAKQNGLWGLIDLADAKQKAGLPEWQTAQPADAAA